jgi:hypothetical protein
MSRNNSDIKVIREPLVESKIQVIDIVRAEHAGGYKIHLWFSDGKNHVVDFEPFLMSARNPMARQFLDERKFQQFRLDYGDLHWNDYEMSFSTEDLYNNDISVEISIEDRQKLETMLRQFAKA